MSSCARRYIEEIDIQVKSVVGMLLAEMRQVTTFRADIQCLDGQETSMASCEVVGSKRDGGIDILANSVGEASMGLGSLVPHDTRIVTGLNLGSACEVDKWQPVSSQELQDFARALMNFKRVHVYERPDGVYCRAIPRLEGYAYEGNATSNGEIIATYVKEFVNKGYRPVFNRDVEGNYCPLSTESRTFFSDLKNSPFHVDAQTRCL